MSFISEMTGLSYGGYLLLPLVITISLWTIVWIFRRPFNGTLLIFLTIPVTIPLVGDAYGGMAFFNVRLYDLLTVVTFCALLAAICLNKHQRFVSTALGPAFCLYCLANLLSLFNSPYITDSMRQFFKLFTVNVTMYLVITTTLNTIKRIEKVIKVMLGAGILVCLVGTLQNVMFLFFGINWFFIETNLRATATFAEAGWYAQYISLLFSIALPLYFSKAFKSWRPWLRLCICIYLVVIASELSRAAYVLAIVVALAVVALRIGGNRLRALVRMTSFIVVALVLASLVYSFFMRDFQFVRLRESGRMFALTESSNVIRIKLARQTCKHIAEHPIIGQGFGTWSRVILSELGGPAIRGGSAFNVILGVLYDGGVLGIVALGLICFSYLNACFSLLRSTDDSQRKALLQVAVLIFVNLFVAAQIHPIWLIGYTWLGISLGMAIVNVVKKSMIDENRLCCS